jgi:hypothetical protein
MNTPTHVIVSALALRADKHPERMWPAVVGGILPDATMFVFYGIQKLIFHTPERTIWETLYFQPHWQAFFDVLNSIPMILIFLGFALWQKWDWGKWLSLSMLLHVACDLPLHHDDGHRHFFPLSDWRFESPVSYWDPGHYGWVAAPAELALLVAGCFILVRFSNSIRVRWLGGIVFSVALLFGIFALAVWIV